MDLNALFAAYYFQYRVQADTPASTDDEYKVFIALANEGINRWANYEDTFWHELYSTLKDSGEGDLTLSTDTEYQTPSDMRKVGGKIRVYNSNNQTLKRIPIIEPGNVQFMSDTASFAYFTGDSNSGFTLHINPEPETAIQGMSLDYIYYKAATLLAAGVDKPQMSQPYFIVHRALANRFRGSRNPYYASAKNDAEDVLQTMKIENDAGSPADPWSLEDHSSGRFGI